MLSEVNQDNTIPGSLEVEPYPWRRAIMWLLLLGPFFFISYGFANWLASGNSDVGHIVFAWERHIPFIPWTIVPYWVIDLLYVISLFICTRQEELNRHALRLLTAQVIAVSCFILLPLTFSFERPAITGVPGWLFTLLSQFDQPYNQAPSLHIALLVILWLLYVRHLPRSLVWPFHVLFALIGVSVLTTYQHHFIDIPTGALLGFLCAWLWPLQGKTVFQTAGLTKQARRWRIAAYYVLGTMGLAGVALVLGGIALWLLWPAVSLLLVAINYLYLGSGGFQKDKQGKMSVAAKWLYYPYLLGARINSRLWTRNVGRTIAIGEGVDFGRMPSRKDISTSDYDAIIDMTAEFDKTHHDINWHAIPCLDLLVPSKQDLIKAADYISEWQQKGSVLVACALGYSRSALAIMAWLLLTKRCQSVDEAIAYVRKQRPGIVINDDARALLAALLQD